MSCSSRASRSSRLSKALKCPDIGTLTIEFLAGAASPLISLHSVNDLINLTCTCKRIQKFLKHIRIWDRLVLTKKMVFTNCTNVLGPAICNYIQVYTVWVSVYTLHTVYTIYTIHTLYTIFTTYCIH